MSGLINTEAEREVVAIVLLDNARLDDVQDMLTPEDFSSAFYRRAYIEMQRLGAQSTPFDPVVVGRLLGEGQDGQEAIEHLVGAVEAVVSTATVRTHALAVAVTGRLRRLVAACSEAINEAHEVSIVSVQEAQKFFGDMASKLGASATFGRAKRISMAESVRDTMRTITERYDNRGKLPGIATGYQRLNELLLGWQRKRFYVIAAQGGVGKTALGINVTVNAASFGAKCFVNSLEMGHDELTLRALASESRVGGIKLETGTLDVVDFNKLGRGVNALTQLEIWYPDSPARTIAALRLECQALKRERGLDIVVVDYVQLMEATEGRGKTREQAVAEVSRGLKRLAMELDLAVIAMAQLSRSNKRNEEPGLQDLRESGALEQDPNVVIALWAETDDAHDVNFKVMKNRGGPLGAGMLKFHRAIQRFEEAPR